jgi:hypothetical protein
MVRREYVWSITDHVCKVCFGRVLVRRDDDGRGHSRCAECGTEVVGDYVALCCCGALLRTGKNAGLRCMRNQIKSPEAPEEIVVVQV